MSDKNSFSVSAVNSYSQALYELANESKFLNKIEDQVVALIKLISESNDFNLLIKDPTNKQEDQLNIISIISEKFEFNNLLNTVDDFDSVVVEGTVTENLKLGNSEIYYLDDVHKRFMDYIRDMFKKYPKFGHAFIIEAITGWNKFGFGNKASANYVGILSKQSDYVSVYDMNCPSDRNYLTDLNKIRLQARFKSTSIKESGSKTGQYRCWSVFSLITKY